MTDFCNGDDSINAGEAVSLSSAWPQNQDRDYTVIKTKRMCPYF